MKLTQSYLALDMKQAADIEHEQFGEIERGSPCQADCKIGYWTFHELSDAGDDTSAQLNTSCCTEALQAVVLNPLKRRQTTSLSPHQLYRRHCNRGKLAQPCMRVS